VLVLVIQLAPSVGELPHDFLAIHLRICVFNLLAMLRAIKLKSIGGLDGEELVGIGHLFK
jgi:hypothetical protein